MEKKYKVLVVYFSQTGRTKDVLDTFLAALRAQEHIDLDIARVETESPFPYPWPMFEMLSIFPETVWEEPIPIKAPAFDENTKYDLVILGCQIWFLSPSLPISSVLHDPRKSKVFSGTPVVPIMTFRRSVSQGLEDLEKTLKGLGAVVIGKISMQVLDKISNPQFKELRHKRLPEGEKEWILDKEELALIGRMGMQLAQSLEQIKRDPNSFAFKECCTILLPAGDPRKKMPKKVEEWVYRFTKKQKKKYLRWGKYIKEHSDVGTRKRRFYIIALSPLYIPIVYFFLPFAILIKFVISLIIAILKLPLLPFRLLKRGKAKSSGEQ
ncbi:flavodoxin family protein [Acidobacteriota bacterium]